MAINITIDSPAALKKLFGDDKLNLEISDKVLEQLMCEKIAAFERSGKLAATLAEIQKKLDKRFDLLMAEGQKKLDQWILERQSTGGYWGRTSIKLSPDAKSLTTEIAREILTEKMKDIYEEVASTALSRATEYFRQSIASKFTGSIGHEIGKMVRLLTASIMSEKESHHSE